MQKANFKSRIERRDRLIGLLRSEEYWTTAELRENLGVSQRTLMRELAELRDQGYPIESDRGRGGGIRLNGRWGIDRLQLSYKEVIELVLALAVVESLRLPLLTGNIESIKQKLYQAFPVNQRRVVSDIRKRILINRNTDNNATSHLPSPSQNISENIAESFYRLRCLIVEYRSEAGEITKRKIEAHYIMLNWPVWYVIAWDRLKLSVRVFRIDRIISASISEIDFTLRPDIIANDTYAPYFKTI